MGGTGWPLWIIMWQAPSMHEIRTFERLLPHRQPLAATLMQHHQSSSVHATIIVHLEGVREIWVSGCFQEAPQCAHKANAMA